MDEDLGSALRLAVAQMEKQILEQIMALREEQRRHLDSFRDEVRSLFHRAEKSAAEAHQTARDATMRVDALAERVAKVEARSEANESGIRDLGELVRDNAQAAAVAGARSLANEQLVTDAITQIRDANSRRAGRLDAVNVVRAVLAGGGFAAVVEAFKYLSG